LYVLFKSGFPPGLEQSYVVQPLKDDRCVAARMLIELACGRVALALANVGSAATIVNDTWQDANRTQPPAVLTAPFTTTYSENGDRSGGDTDIESACVHQQQRRQHCGNCGPSDVFAIGKFVFRHTFFTPPSNPITLANGGIK